LSIIERDRRSYFGRSRRAIRFVAGSATPPGTTYTRVGNAWYFDATETLQVAGSGVIRSGSFIGGVQRTKIEGGARTNLCTFSWDLSNAAWTGAALGVANVTGLDGVASHASTLTDSNAAAADNKIFSVAVAADTNTHTAIVWLKKDAITTRFPIIKLQITGGTTVSVSKQINTQTGAIASDTGAAGSTFKVINGALLGRSDCWVIEMTLPNNGTAGNTLLSVTIYPAFASVLGGAGDVAATGSITVMQVDIYVNTAANYIGYSSPIPTNGASVTRNADNWQLPFAWPPQEMAFYLKYVEQSNGNAVAATRIFQVGKVDNSNGKLVAYRPAQTAWRHSANDVTFVEALTGVTPAVGDIVELRCLIFQDGSVQVGIVVNGGVETVSARTAAKAFDPSYTDVIMHIGGLGGAAGLAGIQDFEAIKVIQGAGRSMADLRAA
jgi:hypothetical protein